MSEQVPHNWIVVKLPEDKGYKVVGGWSGGYLDGDSWRVNSGITKIIDKEDHYLIHGASGSVYKCYKNSEIVRQNIVGILKQLTELGCKAVLIEDIKDG